MPNSKPTKLKKRKRRKKKLSLIKKTWKHGNIVSQYLCVSCIMFTLLYENYPLAILPRIWMAYMRAQIAIRQKQNSQKIYETIRHAAIPEAINTFWCWHRFYKRFFIIFFFCFVSFNIWFSNKFVCNFWVVKNTWFSQYALKCVHNISRSNALLKNKKYMYICMYLYVCIWFWSHLCDLIWI